MTDLADLVSLGAPADRPTGSVDYLRPAGDAGFFGPESMAWRIHANPVALAVGGVAAVILELAEPRVRTGVWEHSIFRTDPVTRMRRTGEATLITTFGPRAAAQARIDMVGRMHARVQGRTPEGEDFQALQPELMTWVQATASWGFLNAYDRYVRRIPPGDQDRYYAEGVELAKAFGAPDPVRSVAGMDALIETMRPRLQPHPIIGEFLDIVSTSSPMGILGRPLQPLVAAAAVDLVPEDLRRRLRLPHHPARLAAAVPALKLLAGASARAPGRVVRQAWARMGLSPP